MRYPQAITSLINASYTNNKKGRTIKRDWAWHPIYYCLTDGGDSLQECRLNDQSRGPILRVECWIESCNQYLYIERLNQGERWSTPKLGEHPGDGQEIYNLEQAAKAIPKDIELSEIHPYLHRWR